MKSTCIDYQTPTSASESLLRFSYYRVAPDPPSDMLLVQSPVQFLYSSKSHIDAGYVTLIPVSSPPGLEIRDSVDNEWKG